MVQSSLAVLDRLCAQRKGTYHKKEGFILSVPRVTRTRDGLDARRNCLGSIDDVADAGELEGGAVMDGLVDVSGRIAQRQGQKLNVCFALITGPTAIGHGRGDETSGIRQVRGGAQDVFRARLRGSEESCFRRK